MDDAEAAKRLNVPDAVRRIFGTHLYARFIYMMMEADPGFADFIARQDMAGIHFLALAVSNALLDTKAKRRELAVTLRTAPRAKALRGILGCSPPPGLTGVLARLGRAPLPGPHYRNLVDLLKEPRARKVLTHSPRITRALLDGLSRLPHALRMPNLALVAGDKDDWDYLAYNLAAIRRKRPGLEDAALRAGLKSVRYREDIRLWRDNLLSRQPFPAPPWKGDEHLRPVRDRRELREASERFGNCLADYYMLDAVLGRKIFYLWEEDEPCVVEISRDDLIDWRVSEIEGIDHTAPDPKTRKIIVDRFASQGILDFSESATGIWDDFL